MKNVVLVILWLLLFGNIIFRFIQFQLRMKKTIYSNKVTHKFLCTTCETINSYPGDKLKENMKRARNSTTINGHTTTYFTVYCPHCDSYTKQKKIFDVDVHKGLRVPIVSYNLDYRMDDYAKPYFKDFLLKGLFPVPFIMLLFGLAVTYL